MKKQQNFLNNQPILYLIATPIGNLDEFNDRAKKIISECDFVACEDTRNTGKLLSLFSISKGLIPCHEHNEEESATNIIELLKNGKKVAYVSDAGYPCVSDPGYRLVKRAIGENINVSVINGSSAFLNALTGSGLPCDHFYFHGFLSPKENQRKEELRNLYNKKETLIFYESPHRIVSTLYNLFEILGNREAVICRELTKLHEEYIRGTLEEFLTLTTDDLIGEMVIIVHGNTEETSINFNDSELKNMVDNFTKLGMTTKDAIKKVSEITKISKNDIYRKYHN